MTALLLSFAADELARCWGRLCAVGVRKRALAESGSDMTESMFRAEGAAEEVGALGIGMLGDLVCRFI
jgi:hypothetical protein